jgi:hypothetical protein
MTAYERGDMSTLMPYIICMCVITSWQVQQVLPVL